MSGVIARAMLLAVAGVGAFDYRTSWRSSSGVSDVGEMIQGYFFASKDEGRGTALEIKVWPPGHGPGHGPGEPMLTAVLGELDGEPVWNVSSPAPARILGNLVQSIRIVAYLPRRFAGASVRCETLTSQGGTRLIVTASSRVTPVPGEAPREEADAWPKSRLLAALVFVSGLLLAIAPLAAVGAAWLASGARGPSSK